MSRKIPRTDWRVYFDRMSRAMEPMQAELEVASLALGDQIEAEWVPLIGITYDPKDDILEIALEDLDHMISEPQEIWVDEIGLSLASLEVVDAEGTRQILKLRAPLMLPAPEAATRPASQAPRPRK
jgi:hypothetical protein